VIDIATAWQIVQSGGSLAALFFVVIGGARGWYVWGWTHRAVERDRDFWRQLALSGTSLAQKSLELAKETAKAPSS
jgi:hypothetical protein